MNLLKPNQSKYSRSEKYQKQSRRGKYTSKSVLLSFMVVTVLLIALGCGAQSEEPATATGGQQANQQAQQEQAQENVSNSLFPVTIRDEADREVIIEEKPSSFVSLLPSTTEILFALGLDEHIIGVSNFCNYPAAALEKEKVGDRDMNLELILMLSPDVAFVQPYHYRNHGDMLEKLSQVGITVVVLGSGNAIEEVYQSIINIRKRTGSRLEAEALVADMQERFAVIMEKAEEVTEPQKVWVEVSPAPNIFTTGQGTFMHEMLEAIRAINAASELEGWVSLTEEEIIILDPEIIVVTYGDYVEKPIEGVLARDAWAEVPAVKNKRIYSVDSDMVTRSGPRLIDGVEILAKAIYPEIFNK